MRRLFILTILLSGLCLFVSGCSDRRTLVGPSQSIQSDSTYFGSWNWMKSRGGFSGATITPQSEGYAIRIELSPDSIYTVSRSGELPISKRFSIRHETLPHSSDPVDIISFPDDPVRLSAAIGLLGRDTLKLVDQYMDGYTSYYLREM